MLLTKIVTTNVYKKDLQISYYHLQIYRCFFLPGHKYASVHEKHLLSEIENILSLSKHNSQQKLEVRDLTARLSATNFALLVIATSSTKYLQR